MVLLSGLEGLRMDLGELKKKTTLRTILALAVTVVLVFFFSGISGLLAGEAASLPKDYWRHPLPPQGEAPMDWGEAERSLDPRSCGGCHEEKLREWGASLHARALSPGLVGQLITSFAGDPGSCMRCHAPLAEQIEAFQGALAQGLGHDTAAQGLAAAGNSCAGCHLRGNRRHGPPKAGSGEIGQGDPEAPHGGAFRTPDLEDSAFCKACHQFPPEWGAVNGKPLENTYAKWKASPQAGKGISCQSCHMPERKHLWRGIHDPEMVKSGLTARIEATPDKARFELLNSGVGHAFPTYVTPKVVMWAVALDAGGEPVEGTETSYIIQRSVNYGPQGWRENFDTRLFPGGSAVLELPWGEAVQARMWLEIDPDDFYDHQVYDGLLESLSGEARKLIAKADGEAGKSRFRLFETELARPH